MSTKTTTTASIRQVLASRLEPHSIVEVLPNGLRFSEEVTPSDSEMEAIGRTLVNLRKEADVLFKFALGDWFHQMKKTHYGAKIEKVRLWFGEESYKAFKNYSWIAGSWVQEERHDDLPWSFFRALARFDQETREKYIRRYRNERLSTKKIEAELGGSKGRSLSALLKALVDIEGPAYVYKLLERELGPTALMEMDEK